MGAVFYIFLGSRLGPSPLTGTFLRSVLYGAGVGVLLGGIFLK